MAQVSDSLAVIGHQSGDADTRPSEAAAAQLELSFLHDTQEFTEPRQSEFHPRTIPSKNMFRMPGQCCSLFILALALHVMLACWWNSDTQDSVSLQIFGAPSNQPYIGFDFHPEGAQRHLESNISSDTVVADNIAEQCLMYQGLALEYCSQWWEACHSIVQSKKDYVEGPVGEACWDKCENVLAVGVLESRMLQWQAGFQGVGFVKKFMMWKIPFTPHFLPIPVIWQLLSFGLGFLFIIPPFLLDEKEGDKNCIFDMLAVPPLFVGMLLLFVALPLGHAFFTSVWICAVFAISILKTQDLDDILVEYPWIDPWVASVTWMKNDYVPPFPLVVLIHWLTMLVLLYQCYHCIEFVDKKTQVTTGTAKRCIEYSWFFLFSATTTLLLQCLTIPIVISCGVFYYIVESGSHGIAWSCFKAKSAAAFMWMPDNAPYQVGLIYAALSIMHGLLSSPQLVSPTQAPDPRQFSMFCIPHTLYAIYGLSVKLVALLLDAVLDVAQSMIFFMQGQPFFGLFNIMGIVIQLLMLLVSAVRGRAENVTFLGAVLQSDIIAHFRASWQAGMVLYQFYEKALREAIGETYLSMSIAIMAYFTVEFHFVGDLQLMLASTAMSVNSIRTGAGEAFELVTAEQELLFPEQTVSFSILPMNDYYARASYCKSRSMTLVAALRMMEGVVAIGTVVLCIASSSAKATYLACACIGFLIVIPRYFLKYGVIWVGVLWQACPQAQCSIEYWLFICFVLPSSLLVFIVWLFFWMFSPAATASFLLLWGGSITVPDDHRRDEVLESPEEETWQETFIYLLDPRLVLARSSFTQFFTLKITFLLTLWALLAVSALAFDSPTFDVSIPVYQIQAALASNERILQWKGSVQVVLLLTSSLGMMPMIATVYILHCRRSVWLAELAEAFEACTSEFEIVREAAENAISSLQEKQLLGTLDEFGSLGYKEEARESTLVQLTYLKIVDSIFGPAHRRMLFEVWVPPARVRNFIDKLEKTDEGWKLTEDLVEFGLKAGVTLSFGGDLAPRSDRRQDFGKILPSKVDARLTIEQVASYFYPSSICLVFGCLATEFTEGYEASFRKAWEVEKSEIQSPSTLAHHIQLVANKIEDLSSAFAAVNNFTSSEETLALQQVKACLDTLVDHCRQLTLHIKFQGMSETSYTHLALDADVNVHDLTEKLVQAVASVPHRSAILQALLSEHQGDHGQDNVDKASPGED